MNSINIRSVELILASLDRISFKNEKGMIKLEHNKNSLSSRCTYQNNDPYRILKFLWQQYKDRKITLYQSNEHKVIICPVFKDRAQQFSLELVVKNQKEGYLTVENLLPEDKRDLRKLNKEYPLIVRELKKSRWLKDLKVTIHQFNSLMSQA